MKHDYAVKHLEAGLYLLICGECGREFARGTESEMEMLRWSLGAPRFGRLGLSRRLRKSRKRRPVASP